MTKKSAKIRTKKTRSPRLRNPDGLFSIFHQIGNGYFLMFDKDLGPFIINKSEDYIFIYDYRSKRFRYRGQFTQLYNEVKTKKIILSPITDKEMLSHFAKIMTLSEQEAR
jgi:hypothetical protein